MFFATGIPVIVMILSKGREESDILFIDASASYAKEGTQNVLREKDIKKIFDTVKARKDIKNFSKVVNLDEIIENDYNLNIPRYISAAESKEALDPYSVMTGTISGKALLAYDGYWAEFPGLKQKIFDMENDYYIFKPVEIKDVIFSDDGVKKYIADVGNISEGFRDYLITSLIWNDADVKVHDRIIERLFRIYGDVKLLDGYSVFQAFSDEWDIVENDLVRIHNEGKQICRETEPDIVLQKDNSTKKYVEVQKGIKGKVFPIRMIQEAYFRSELDELERLNSESVSLEGEIEELWNELEVDTKSNLSKEDSDDHSKMDQKKLNGEVKLILAGVSFPETDILEEYLALKNKQKKIDFISDHSEIEWDQIKCNKDMTYGAAAVRTYIDFLKLKKEFDMETEEGKIIGIKKKIELKSDVNKKAKMLSQELEEKAVEKIGSLTDGEVDDMLTKKWINPVMLHIEEDVKQVMMKLVNALEALKEQYKDPLPRLDEQIEELNRELHEMLGELCGSPADMEAIDIFRKGLL